MTTVETTETAPVDSAAVIATMAAALTWSPYQLKIFENIANGKGHTCLKAVAGSGKTTVIVEGMKYVPAGCSTLFVAFNKAIAEALKLRAPKGVEVSTLHSYGLKTITAGLGRLRIDGNRVDGFIRTLLHEEERNTFEMRRDLAKVVSLAKGMLAFTRDDIDDIIDAFGVESAKDEKLDQFITDVLELLEASKARELDGNGRATGMLMGGTIDFDDMIWLPVVLNLKQRQFDRVFVDETQDLSPCQIEMVIRAVKYDGRICAVGDPMQCIPAGQMVSTPRGPTPIEKLREGDEVLAVKAGEVEPRRIVKKTCSKKEKAFEFDLGEYGTFQATAEHVLFASIDDPRGSFVYLMYRPDMGFRIGVSRTVGKRGKNFHVRTQQEQAERLWVVQWFETYAEAAEMEAVWAYTFSIPREPFRSRENMWCSEESTARLFGKFGANGRRLLDEMGFDFNRPNYMAKATARGRIAVNLSLATKDGHKVEIESSIIDRESATAAGMLATDRGTMRLRKCFQSLREARTVADSLAEKFGGYVVESLSCTSANRRTFAVPSVSVNIGMMVPIVGEDGKVLSVPVLGRREVPVTDCYDLEVEGLGNFVVNGVVVHNCIYAFRGAGPRAFDNVVERLEATVLPLSVSYRCAASVIREAQRFVPEIQAAPDAIEGEVLDATIAEMKRDAKGGDFILSRTNAPLIKLCMSFLSDGRKAAIQGRDIGASLVAFVKKSKTENVDALRTYVESWCQKEIERLAKKNRDTQAVEDRAECILAISEGADSVADVVTRIESLFSDASDDARIVLSTTHKAKGLERDRVWMLTSTYGRRPGIEESALSYVAITRAKKTLVMVSGQ